MGATGINMFCILRSIGPVGPTWAGLCSQKLKPVKVNRALRGPCVTHCGGENNGRTLADRYINMYACREDCKLHSLTPTACAWPAQRTCVLLTLTTFYVPSVYSYYSPPPPSPRSQMRDYSINGVDCSNTNGCCFPCSTTAGSVVGVSVSVKYTEWLFLFQHHCWWCGRCFCQCEVC